MISASESPSIELDGFHRDLLDRLARRPTDRAARLVGPGRSLTIELTAGAAWTYRAEADRVTVEPGASGSVRVLLDADAFADLVTERWSVFGLLYPGRVTVAAGTFEQFSAWEPVLQNLWFERPLYDEMAIAALVDVRGDALDLHRSFTLDDDDAEIGHFLRTAGFVVLRSVFSPDEIAELDAEERRMRAAARPDDRRSWWATDAAGNAVCCRLTYTGDRSEAFARLSTDPRMERIASWSDDQLVPVPDRLDGTSVVIKNPDVVQGLSDLPWHRDCGMGGHPVLCPGLNIGIQFDRADAANGQLAFLAGSHRHTNLPSDIAEHPEWPVVAVEAEPGDVTVHFAHVLHVAPPPTAPDAHRRASYVGFSNPTVLEVIAPGQGYNDVVFSHGDGRVRNVDELS
jgi:hypothetical protein